MSPGSKNGRQMIRLKEVCQYVTVGHVGPMTTEYVEEGIPFFRSQNIEPFRLKREGLKFISERFHKKLSKSALKPGYVAIVRTGYPGTACVVPDSFPIANCADLVIVRPDRKKLNPTYLTALLNSAWGKGRVSGSLVGVAQQHFNVTVAKELEFPLPPIDEQDRLADILDAYNQLIENNLRRIQILEEMAQNLYREWFVTFRFPGHQHVKMIDSPLGKIPERWEVTSLADSCDLVMGQSPKSEYYNETGDGLPFHQGVTHYGHRYPYHKTFTTVLNRVAEEGDILFSVRAPVGRINLADTSLVVGRGLSAIRNRSGIQWFTYHQLIQWFTYHQLKERFQVEDSIGGGTIYKSVTKRDMETIPYLMPCKHVVKQFDSIVSPISDLIRNLIYRNRTLTGKRNLLLQVLMKAA